MKRPFKIGSNLGFILLGLLVFVTILGFVFTKFFLPPVLQSKLEKTVRETCADCELEIASTEIGFLSPGLIVFNGIEFSGGQKDRSAVAAKIPRLAIQFAVLKSITSEITIRSIEASTPKITYMEGEAPKRVSKRAPETASEKSADQPKDKSVDGEKKESLKFVIDQVHVEKMDFVFANTQAGKTNYLKINNVSGDFSNLGNTTESFNALAEAHLQGQIENSGKGELDVAALLRPGPHYIDVKIQIQDQKLSEMNEFFTPNDGLIFKGSLQKAKGEVSVRGAESKTKMLAVFKDLDVTQKKTKDSGALKTALTNLAVDLLAKKSNVGGEKDSQQAEKQLTRDKDEAIVHFILRSLKLALIGVVA